MARKSDVPLQRHTIKLFEGDLARLEDFFPNQQPTVIIRLLVRKTIRSLESAAAKQKLDPSPEVSLKVNLDD